VQLGCFREKVASYPRKLHWIKIISQKIIILYIHFYNNHKNKNKIKKQKTKQNTNTNTSYFAISVSKYPKQLKR
jgi:hypothetical protein